VRPWRGLLAPWLGAGLLLAGLGARAEPPSAAAELAPWAGRTVTAIDLAGRDVTREHVVRREIQTPLGQPLDPATVLEDLQRLHNLGIFAEAGAGAEADGEGVRLTYTVREMPPWVPYLSVVYTEENGFSAGPGLTALNLTGRQVTLSARAEFGGATQYRARLLWPWITGNHVSLDLYAAHLDRDDTLNGFHEKSDELTPTVGRYLGPHGRLAATLSLFRLRADVPGKTLSPDDVDQLVRLGVSLGWDTRDRWDSPRRGWLNELELTRTGGWLGGDGDFLTLNLDARRWQPAGKRRTLMLSGLATLQSGVTGRDLPTYMDFHMGGANTIRGYSLDVLGHQLYGKNQLVGTAEYSYELVPVRRWDFWKWSLRMGLDAAVFGDAGIAWEASHDLTLPRARAGLGAGLRLRLPATEMVRFDLGWSPADGFHFHLAALSKPEAQRKRLR